MAYSSLFDARKAFQLTTLSVALTLAGCGGSGGTGGVDAVPPFKSGGGTLIEDNKGNDGTTTSAQLNISDIQLFEKDTNNSTTEITSDGVTAKVKVTDAAGEPIQGALVTFSGQNIGFDTTNGAKITNSNGEVSVIVRPNTQDKDTGSYSLQATVEYKNESANSNTLYYTLNAKGGDNGQENAGDSAIKIENSELLNTQGDLINFVGIGGAYYKVKVTDNLGKGIANAKVTFNIDAGGVSLSQPTSGSILTDKDGMAQIFLKPDSISVSGAYTISAEVTYQSDKATVSKVFSVQPTNISFGSLNVDNNNLQSGGQTSLNMQVTGPTGQPLSGAIVVLSSSCGQVPNQATSDSQGNINFVYKAINADGSLCEGAANINVSSGTVTKSVSVNIQKAEATSIIYTANDLSMGIKGSGSSSTGRVQFTVYSDKTPLSNTEVELSLEKSPLGLTFGPNKNNVPFRVKTDENGVVSVNLYPGSTPGPVEIKAALVSDPSVYSLSKNISVASARVTQKGLSLSWGRNVLDWGYDGDSTSVVARMVDRNGNAVPDGTVIIFTAEGGKITPSCATVNGECQVTFSTQNPRPGDGRATVMAVAEGEKDYIDANRNNAWDPGEEFVHNIGDTFRDDNEDGEFQEGEFIYPMTTQAKGVCENNIDKYINLKFPTYPESYKKNYKDNYIRKSVSPNMPNTCNSELDAIVRHEIVTLLSDGGKVNFTIVDNKTLKTKQEQKITPDDSQVVIRVNTGVLAYSLNPMPSGTVVSGAVKDNTNSKPVAFFANNEIKVVNANPNSAVTVTNTYEEIVRGKKGADDTTKTIERSYFVKTDSKGEATISGVPSSNKVTVEQDPFNCQVEQFGDNKLSAIVPTGKPLDQLGTYHAFGLTQCRAGDTFTITTTSPRGVTIKQTYTITN